MLSYKSVDVVCGSTSARVSPSGQRDKPWVDGLVCANSILHTRGRRNFHKLCAWAEVSKIQQRVEKSLEPGLVLRGLGKVPEPLC